MYFNLRSVNVVYTGIISTTLTDLYTVIENCLLRIRIKQGNMTLSGTSSIHVYVDGVVILSIDGGPAYQGDSTIYYAKKGDVITCQSNNAQLSGTVTIYKYN